DPGDLQSCGRASDAGHAARGGGAETGRARAGRRFRRGRGGETTGSKGGRDPRCRQEEHDLWRPVVHRRDGRDGRQLSLGGGWERRWFLRHCLGSDRVRRDPVLSRGLADVRGVMALTLVELQSLIRDMYGAKDSRRGVEGTFMWFMEEVGELSAALRGDRGDANLALEFADVLAWLATLANIAGVDLEQAIRAKYGAGCPGCGRTPSGCTQAENP